MFGEFLLTAARYVVTIFGVVGVGLGFAFGGFCILRWVERRLSASDDEMVAIVLMLFVLSVSLLSAWLHVYRG